MIRKPLQLVDSNVQKNSIPIFDDFKAAQTKPNTGHSAKKVPAVKRSSLANRLLIVVVIMQQKELKMARLKSAFLKLANNALVQKPARAEAQTESAQRLPTNTPKKRRFEDNKESEADDLETGEGLVSGTPPRSRSNTMHSTPYSTKRDSSTPSSHRSRPVFATPGRPPLLDATNRVNNRSVLSDQMAESPKQKQPLDESLSNRLKQVEDSLQKLQVLGDLENVRAAAATLKSPQRTRIYNSLRSDSAELTAQNTHNNATKENIVHEPAKQQQTSAAPAIPVPTATPSTSTNEASSHTPQVPAPSHTPVASATVLGTGSNLQQPQLAEHLVLQATIQRATKASLKTLLKSRDILPNASETRDQLAAYQQDSAKIATSLSPVHPNAAAEATTQAKLLETSIVHYHHATSKLYPLSPLGDQSIRGNTTAPVPLSELSMLKEKMTSWRSKYAPKPNSPPSSV